MAPSVEKKLAELEMGLLHLQQNIDIPDITLPINPTVQAVVKKALEENRRPKVAELGDKVEDSSFLNGLQNGVNRWIREIQKVSVTLSVHINLLEIDIVVTFLVWLGYQVGQGSFVWNSFTGDFLLAES